MSLDFLFNGAPPQNVTGSTASVAGMPDWYQEYLRGLAGKATEVAGQGYTQYPGQRLAGFTPDQMNAFDMTRQMSGAWQPYMQQAVNAAGEALPTAAAYLAQGAEYGQGALNAAAMGANQANSLASAPTAGNFATNMVGAASGFASDPRAYQHALSSGLRAEQASAAGLGRANELAGNMGAGAYALDMGRAAGDYARNPDSYMYALGSGAQAQGAAADPTAVQAAVGAAGQANAAVGGGTPLWTQNFQQYMSPYISQVTDEIARLGNRNLQEGALSSLNDSFIMNGGFGSDRNADMIGRAIRDAQRDISGQQALALQQGYQTSANIFNQDAARGQQQQQLQAGTALQGGQLAANAAGQYAQLGANTALQAGQLGAGALNNYAQLGANTALQSGQLGANTLFNQQQLGANTALQGAQLGANTALQSGQLGATALGNYAQLGANTALQGGQLGANTLFNQQQLGVNTALQGGQLVGNAGLSAGQMSNAGGQIGAAAADAAAQRFGALGQLGQQLGYQDIGALGGIGSSQQALQQQGLDIGYQNFLEQRGWNWDTLNNLGSIIRGMQLPTSQTQVTNQPYGDVGTSPLQWFASMYGTGASNGAKTGG